MECQKGNQHLCVLTLISLIYSNDFTNLSFSELPHFRQPHSIIISPIFKISQLHLRPQGCEIVCKWLWLPRMLFGGFWDHIWAQQETAPWSKSHPCMATDKAKGHHVVQVRPKGSLPLPFASRSALGVGQPNFSKVPISQGQMLRSKKTLLLKIYF